VPRYDCRCPEHGTHEVFRRIGEPLSCEAAPPRNAYRGGRKRRCFAPVEQVITALTIPGMRMSCGGESAPSEARRQDGTADFNMGLPGVETIIGTREDGKPKLAYRPITHNEVATNRNAREIAKRAGLEPLSGGAYRSVGR
jgi:hypothetical protein